MFFKKKKIFLFEFRCRPCIKKQYFKAMEDAHIVSLSTSFLEGFVAFCSTDDKEFHCSGFHTLLDLFILNKLILEKVLLQA